MNDPSPDDKKINFCIMIVLLEQVLQLTESEPNPEILKKQSLRLIDSIITCCDHCKITSKKRFFGLD